MGSIVVEKDRAETLTFYPPWQEMTPPTAADVRVGTPAVSLPPEGSETACSIDSVSTTLSAAASRGTSSLDVASAVGITVGRRYLITYVGSKLVVTVRAVVSSTVHIVEPLPVDLPSGATFVGLAVTTTISALQSAQIGVGILVLRMTLNGVVRRLDYNLRIEPKKFPLYLTTEECLQNSEIRRHRPASDPTLEDTIRQAWEMELRPRLLARGILEHRITSPGEVVRPHLEAVVLRVMRASDATMERIEDQEKRLNRVIGDMLASREYWYDDDTTTKTRPDDRSSIQATEYIRLVR